MAPLTAQSQPLSSASSQGAAEAAEGTGARRTDEELMAAYKEGEVAAFHELVKRHERPLYRFCLRSLGNQDAAADAAQEVFLRVVKNAARWERRAKFTTWMYTIARNFCIDEARKRNFRKTDSLNEKVGRDDDGGTEKLDQVADGGPGSDRLTDSMHIRQVVDLTLAELPEEQREVFCMRQYGGLPFKEIAEAVGAGENTVKSRMRYALAALQRALLAAGFEPPDSS
jgi:RNA polymerase sigma-70 factor (ECF subfamily)